MKRMKVFIITAILILLGFQVAAYGTNRYINLNLSYDGANHKYIAEEIFLKVDGTELKNLTMPPIILNSYSLVPAREVFEKTGAVVSWNADREEVYISRGNDLLVLKINADKASYNNKEVEMQIPAKLINSKTMIPVRFVSETLGYGVDWDISTRTIIINSKAAEATEATTEAPAQAVTETIIETTTGAPANQAAAEDYKDIPMGIDRAGLPDNLSELTAANHYDCNIVDISAGEDYSYIKISTDDEISRIEAGNVLSDRYYLDFYGAKSGLGDVRMKSYVDGISEVRMAHRIEKSVNVTRVAMDISRSDFIIRMTPDRKSVYIYYPSPEVTDYKMVSDIAEDVFTVMGHDLVKPDVLMVNNTIKMTFAATELSAASQTLRRNCLLVDNTVIDQIGKDTVITFNLKDSASYKTTYGENQTSIAIYKPSYQNMNVDSNTDTLTLKKNPGQSFSISSVVEEDDYNNLKYTITLPGNFSSTYGTGDITLENSKRLNSVNISLVGGKTVLTFYEKLISAFKITEDSSNIYITCMRASDMYDKVVVLDAGHGGKDVGTSANGIVEKEATLDILLRIKDLIDKDGTIKAYYTRVADTFPTLAERAAMSNSVDCPFVSVHINSAGTANPGANGVEVYWKNDNVNEDGLTSSALAKAIYDKMLRYLGTNGRGVKTADYQVLRESENPAALIEVCFVTNPHEAELLKTDSFKNNVARAVFEALKENL